MARAFLVAGGLDAFWKLALTFDQTLDLNEALCAAFDVTYAEFDGRWRARLLEQ